MLPYYVGVHNTHIGCPHATTRKNTRVHTTRWAQVGTHAKHVGLHTTHVAPRSTLSWEIVGIDGLRWTGVDSQRGEFSRVFGGPHAPKMGAHNSRVASHP